MKNFPLFRKKPNRMLIAKAIKIKKGNFSQYPQRAFIGENKDVFQNSGSIWDLKSRV
jgi:hypothetical protein